MSYLQALFLTILGVVLMSFESLLIKLTSIPAQNFTFYFGLSIFFSANLMLLIKEKKQFLALYQSHFQAILLAAFFMGVSNFFFVLAIKHTSVASAVFILSTAPLISALIGFFFFNVKTPRRLFVATFFVFIGLFLILYNDLDAGTMKGNFYAFLCVLSFTSFFSVLERYKTMDRLACIGSGGLVASFLAFLSLPLIAIPDTNSLSIIFFMGAILTPISRLLIGIGSKVLPSTDMTLLMIIETLLAPIWVWLFLGEAMSPSTLLGGGIIVVTLVIYAQRANEASKR